MINISIDLTKLDKSRIKEHSNGSKYYNITVDEKRQPDQYGNTHTCYNTPTKEEREARKEKAYIGSGKEFKFNNQQTAPAQQAQPSNFNNAPAFTPNPNDVSDLPF